MTERRTRILIVEDSESDREAFRYFLQQRRRDLYAIEEATSGEEALAACHRNPPDCVVLDYRLPDTDGLQVLQAIRNSFGPNTIPVLFLTGAGDERLAVQALKNGAHDYLAKGAGSLDLLDRAVENAIDRAQYDRERREHQKELEENERKLRAIVSTAPAIVYIIDIRTQRATFISDHAQVMTGYSAEEILGMEPASLRRLLHSEDFELVKRQFLLLENASEGEGFECEYRIRHKRGEWRTFLSRDRVFERDENGRVRSIVGAASDITERRVAELNLRADQMRIQLAEQAAKIGFWDLDLSRNEAYFSPSYLDLVGLPERAETPGLQDWLSRVHPEDRASALDALSAALEGAPYDEEFRVMGPDGVVRWLNARALLIKEGDMPARLVGASIDITELKRAHEDLRQANEKLRALMQAVPAAIFAAMDREGKQVEGNRMAYELLELPVEASDARGRMEKAGPERFRLINKGQYADDQRTPIEIVAQTGEPMFGHECELEFEDGRKRYILGNTLPLLNAEGLPEGALSAYLEVSEIKRIEQELRRSNEDLEHFASMASHDLQEPLRSIISFAELLQRKANLSEESEDYLRYIRTGAQRMKVLVTDLLSYAQAASAERNTSLFSWHEALQEVLDSLQKAIGEGGVQIQNGQLPTLNGDRVRIKQLLQNLIGNAIKYRATRSPVICIEAERRGEHWLFSVRDNGIGIEMEFAEKIFEPFKRLHRREQFSGTGIGLAICKRVVEQHGGTIWVDSRVGEGSTFYFTIPYRNLSSESGTGQAGSGEPTAEPIGSSH